MWTNQWEPSFNNWVVSNHPQQFPLLLPLLTAVDLCCVLCGAMWCYVIEWPVICSSWSDHDHITYVTYHNRVIRLNVGGTVFMTTRDTLLNTTTFFSGLLAPTDNNNTISATTDSNGDIFIDRSPVVFNRVLDYLRSGSDVLVCLEVAIFLHTLYGVLLCDYLCACVQRCVPTHSVACFW